MLSSMASLTEKYRPKTLDAVRGNDKAISTFLEWASNWNPQSPAVVLHGSPGIGKTSAAHALALDMGWDIIELNASDQRTAKIINRIARNAANTGTISGGSSGQKLVILDEADNLHGTYDRGGAAALTKLIKESSQPIVLIANDYYNMSRGLRNVCEAIRFNDISSRSILPILRDICRSETISPENGSLELIAEKNSGDLRGAINDLQATVSIDGSLPQKNIVTSSRNREENIFEFLNNLFKNLEPRDALTSSYDVNETPDNLLSWIDENVPKDFDSSELSRAYDHLSRAETWLTRTRTTQNYAYWRYARDIMVAGVAVSRNPSPKGGWTRYGPPRYWQRLGASRGSRDLRDTVAKSISKMSGTSVGTSRIEIMPLLKTMVQNCKNRLLTINVAAAYELELDTISYLTGSGKTTKKVKEILEEATALRDSENHVETSSPDVFFPAHDSSAIEDSEPSPNEQPSQSDLSNFL